MPGRIRSEADAFAWVMWVGGAAATVIVLTLLTRPLVGSLWGLALLVAAGTIAFRAWRRERNARRRRVLIITETALDPAAVRAEHAEAWSAEATDVLVLVPSGAPADGPEHQKALQAMELSLQAVREAGGRAQGRVTGTEPEATAAARAEFAPDDTIDQTRRVDGTME